jgi:hypothetical protein
LRRELAGVSILWIALAAGLSAISTQARDWFDMTDELRYERLSLAIARTHSLVPRIHGVDIRSFSQLYPLVIAPVFAHGSIAADLWRAHLLGAWVMSSACIPAFLLARRVLRGRAPAYAVAVLAVCMPWIVYSSMLMTEVAAYPAFVWALLALQWAIVGASWRRDLAALVAIGVAFLARAELIVLVAVLPIALLAFAVGRAPGRPGARLAAGLRDAVRGHRLLVVAYGLVAAGAIALALTGSLGGVVGVYGVYSTGHGLLSRGLAGSFAEHAATFSLAFAILPFVVAAAWLLANLVGPSGDRERDAFACLGSVAVVALLAQATEFDVHYTGYVHDRFLLYLVPVVVTAALCAVTDRRPPRWSLALPAAVVSAGFATGAIPSLTWADPLGHVLPDTPVAVLYHPIVRVVHGLTRARVVLVAVTIASAALFALVAARLRRERSTALLAGLMVVALPLATGYVLARTFDAPSWSSRPLSVDPSAAFDWIDRAAGPKGSVALVPGPVSSAWFPSEQYWRDLEFWNRSVTRDVQYPAPGRFEYTGIWFPKLFLGLDPRTGTADMSPAPYAVQPIGETRFRLSGPSLVDGNGARLIRAGPRWRADWLTLGAYDDGWTRPGVPTRVRVFSSPGQRRALMRYLTIRLDVPIGRPVTVASNVQRWRGDAPATASVRVCVPARGFAVVRLASHGQGPIPGDLRDAASAQGAARVGGVHIGEIALADEVGGRC